MSTDERVALEPERPSEWALYQQLSVPFEQTFTRPGAGGMQLTYITGEQAISRLNETLGFLAWSFRVLEHGFHAEADELWVLGELVVTLDGRSVTRQQFGSNKVKRDRASGIPIDLGFDLKGAGTDALKKCASLLGLALYLYERDAPPDPGRTGDSPTRSSGNGQSRAADAPAPVGELVCADCGEPLTETRFKDGTVWTPQQLAIYGNRKFGRILNMACYRLANEALKRAATPLTDAF